MKGFKIQSLDMLLSHFKDGTFGEVIDDWKWIFSYSRRYTGSIILYTVLGLLSTTMGVVSSIAIKYVIDIITGYQMDKLGILIAVMAGSIVFSAVFKNWTQWIAVRLKLDINNDIQIDIFEKIMDADWLALSKYPNGDLLNRFNSDVNTVSSNAVSWLPTIIIALYNFVVTFFVIMYYDKIMALIALASAPLLMLSSRVI
ncbi:MAG: ABC transporter ATP-binding protein, partial [Firmicutes bacterium]|nr:ABC transporter ATP-binding protein [Bacillota bacterium]